MVKPYSWQFVSHSIPFVSSHANPSLGLPLGAPMVEPKSASAGWVGFFSGSPGAAAGAGGVGFGAISGILCFANRGSLNRILPIFVLVLHLWSNLGGGLPHSIVSLSHCSYENRLCNILH